MSGRRCAALSGSHHYSLSAEPNHLSMSPVRDLTLRSLLTNKTQLMSALPYKQRFFKYHQPHVRQTTASILSLLSQQQTWKSVRRCIICGGVGFSDAYYCKECTQQDKDRDGCPKIVNLGTSKTDLFYEHKKYGFKKR
ncbi:hypothetical protein GOP47_0025343 [Adiantum capillus-veneris]|uniref:Uncharacterized protein n=1 Tax=Adiantum capillus-veneris TaxID=13818 RepID=A0A9D4U200_ADICA|nr:hypothetical protein GOP47_0025343 [Adiantum capillus-veneris]